MSSSVFLLVFIFSVYFFFFLFFFVVILLFFFYSCALDLYSGSPCSCLYFRAEKAVLLLCSYSNSYYPAVKAVLLLSSGFLSCLAVKAVSLLRSGVSSYLAVMAVSFVFRKLDLYRYPRVGQRKKGLNFATNVFMNTKFALDFNKNRGISRQNYYPSGASPGNGKPFIPLPQKN